MSDDGTPGIAILVALVIGMVTVGWICLRLSLLALTWLFAVTSALMQVWAILSGVLPPISDCFRGGRLWLRAPTDSPDGV